MPVRVDVYASRELTALAGVLRDVEKPIAARIRTESKAVIQNAWQEELRAQVTTTYEAYFAATGRAVVSNQNVILNAAKVRGHAFSGGMDLRKSWPMIERGSSGTLTRSYPVSGHTRAGHRVRGYRMNNRHVDAAFKRRTRGGYVAGPAQALTASRALRLWVQTAMRTLVEQLEQGR